ncbi:MAG: hypothetical protein P8Z67_12220 [Gammaproteobacteria bacterium]
MRIIEVLADCGHADTLRSIAEQQEILDVWVDRSEEESRCTMRQYRAYRRQRYRGDWGHGHCAIVGSEYCPGVWCHPG